MTPPQIPSFWEAARVWARIGALSFGGPAGQIALMHRMLVEERRWIGERRFLHALNYCMLLPGPEAQQLADDWYDFDNTGRRWSDAITEDEVAALYEGMDLAKYH